MTLAPMQAVLAGWLFAAVVMTLLWILQRKSGDAGIVDVGWAALLGVLAIFYAVVMEGEVLRRVVVAVLAGAWSFRLAFYLLVDRVMSGEEDGRYQALRETWSHRLQFKFFVFFQAQGLLDVILSLPFLVAILNQSPVQDSWGYAAVVVWLISVVGESMADRQLAAFRGNPENKGGVCQVGLWRYSRHPNYFFEWLHWWSYVLLAVGSSLVWLSFLGPVLILFLILKVTGIPPTEARAIQSRGEAYRRYQQTTSAFVPWFRRSEP
ncbi:MAG: DUF1295 domain-containing protein [Planctomycetota bacterium]|jgi:steroid 5-alpha reductase family enzyme